MSRASRQSQGADSCKVVGFCGLLNPAEKNGQNGQKYWPKWTVIFRRGTAQIRPNEMDRMDRMDKEWTVIFRRGTTQIHPNENGQNGQNGQGMDSHFQEGYELF